VSPIRPHVTRRGSRLDWVKFDFELARDGSVDPTDKALYAAIASFVDVESRESPETADVDLNGIPQDVPTRPRLAACIGRSVDTVDRCTKRLESKGLLRVHRQADPDNPRLMLPSEYELLDHELWDQRAAERAAHRAARRAASEGSPSLGGGRMDAATPGRTSAATPGRMGAAVKEVREVEEERGEEKAVSPRSGGDGRRPSDRSSAREAESGSAASSNDHPSPEPQTPRQRAKTSSSKAKHTRQQLDLVRAVRAHFPADLLNGWTNPKTGQVLEPLPDVWELSQAILEALAGDVPAADRTVEQLGARIVQRWNHHGWAVKFYAGEIDRPVGAAVAMVRPLKAGDRYGCANPRCEAGKDVDTGEECPVCPERLAARKAERRAQQPQDAPGGPQADVPSQRPSGGFLPPRECPCGNPIGKTVDDPLCEPCRKDADDAEETARLRAELAAQYGTPDQVEAYTYGRAPF